MKKLTTCIVLLLTLMFSGTAFGQYSNALPSVELPSFMQSFVLGLSDSIKDSFKIDKNKFTISVSHPDEEDIILNKLDVAGNVYAKNSSDIFRPANNRGGTVQSSFGQKDTLHLSSIREAPLVTLRIEYDSLEIVNKYKHRPKFIPGTDGLYPQKESYFFEKGFDGKNTLYVIELVFRNMMKMNLKNADDVHIHGHICHPDDIDPTCY